MTATTWQGQRVFITGVCGTIGQELLRQLVVLQPAEIIGIDNNESELFFLAEAYRQWPFVRLYLGDLRNRDQLMDTMRGMDVVLHAAAYKHVTLCEQSPRDAVHTNILGTQNVIDAALANRVQRVLFTSSDKAVNPTNVMGTSKLMGERLMTAANAQRRDGGPIFTSTRFGNVLGSRGSVIPLFKQQIKQGGPVTITDPRMTRFIMTLEEAVGLVMQSVFIAHGGEVFVTKMPVVRVSDLARAMIETLAPRYGFDPARIVVKEIGSKPGEKLFEELLNDEETRRTIELSEYFIIFPAFKAIYREIDYWYAGASRVGVDYPYNSMNQVSMSFEKLKAYLVKHRLLDNENTPPPCGS